MLDPTLTVAEVLHTYPQTERVFISLGTACVGCYLMSFCSLQEVAKQYELPLEGFLQALSKAIPDQTETRSNKDTVSGTKHDIIHPKGKNYEVTR